MKKRTLAVALCVAMVLSMAACGGSKPAETQAPAPATEAAAPETEAAAPAEGETEAPAEAAAPAGEITDLDAYALEGLKTSIECEPIELSLGCSGTVEGTLQGDVVAAAIKHVSEWTNGNFVVNFYPSGQLGGDAEMIEGMQMGSVDMYTGTPTSQVTVVPELAVLDIGGLYKDVESCQKVLDSYYEQFNAAYETKGIHLLALFAPNFRILTTSKQINSAADLQGMKIRVQENPYHITFWKTLGCNPTPLAFGELYIALQQGMMDAQENPWGSIVGAKLSEVQPYIYFSNHIPFVSTYSISLAKYNSMSDGQKEALNQMVQFIVKYNMAGQAADDAKLQAQAESENGCQCFEISDDIRAQFDTAAQAVIDQMKGEGKLSAEFIDGYVAAARG